MGLSKDRKIEGKEKEMKHGTKARGNILQVCHGNSTRMEIFIIAP